MKTGPLDTIIVKGFKDFYKIDFRKMKGTTYNKYESFSDMDVTEPGGELEVTDHGWTDSELKVSCRKQASKYSWSRIDWFTKKKSNVQDAQTADSSPTFFISSLES